MKVSTVPYVVGCLILAGLLSSCGGGDGGGGVEVGDYIILAWNDLGMHCLNPTYDQAVILPPYNTVWAQVIKRGNPPESVTSNLTVEYEVINNTYSDGKRNYGQFWAYVFKLFGISLESNTGLNLSDPNRHNGLSGTMVEVGDHFEINGIPVTPVDDDQVWNPYQVIELTLKDSTGTVLAQTQATLPTSDEINCAKCHNGNDDPFADILETHDRYEGTNLAAEAPVLCAKCHGSPVLGTIDSGSGKYLSQAMHGFHSTVGASCYDCHPGSFTRCSRSLAHTADDGNCTACHGDMAEVADSIASGARIPWVDEPACADCHTGVAEVDTGATLFRNATGHGGIYCAACHGSPHAMIPTSEASDNYQAIQYQRSAKTIGSCGACHDGSRGDGSGEFLEQHGSGGRDSACNVCHTVVTSNNTALWPHQFQWRERSGSGGGTDE